MYGLGWAIAGAVVLLGLIAFLKVREFQRLSPEQALGDAKVLTLAQIERKHRLFLLALGISAMLYGLIKIAAHASIVATRGIEQFATLANVFRSTLTSDYLVFTVALAIGCTFILIGLGACLRQSWCGWFAFGLGLVELIISFAVSLAFYGDRKGGLFLILATSALPIVLVVLAAGTTTTGVQVRVKRRLERT